MWKDFHILWMPFSGPDQNAEEKKGMENIFDKKEGREERKIENMDKQS